MSLLRRFSAVTAWLGFAGLGLVGCAREPAALTAGATWLSTEVPPAMQATVAHYEQRQFFGLRNDPHGWMQRTLYTLRKDAPGPTAGCSFVGWIPGTWIARGSTLVVTTPSSDSGSLEMHDCPGSDEVRTVPRPPHFTRAESPYRLDGKTLHLERQFGENPPFAADLTRQN